MGLCVMKDQIWSRYRLCGAEQVHNWSWSREREQRCRCAEDLEAVIFVCLSIPKNRKKPVVDSLW